MSNKIEWCDETWNPVKMYCTPVSEGCKNCYALRQLGRNLPNMRDYPRKGEEPVLDASVLDHPLRWWKPKKIFVCSMGDLFREDVKQKDIVEVFDISFQAYIAQGHISIFVTKRPERMAYEICRWMLKRGYKLSGIGFWFLATAENQQQLDERTPFILEIPAAVRGVCIEPMLERVSFRWAKWCPVGHHKITDHLDGLRMLDWVICGAETGRGARYMYPNQAFELRDQCKDAGIPFFFKKFSKMPGREVDLLGCNMPREYPK